MPDLRRLTVSMHIAYPEQLGKLAGKCTAILKSQIQYNLPAHILNITDSIASTVKQRFNSNSSQKHQTEYCIYNNPHLLYS